MSKEPSFFKRLFCLGGQPDHDVEHAEWITSHSAAVQHEQLYAKTKALDVVDTDVDYHYHGLKLTQPVIDPSSMKRVHHAQLPGRDAERLVELLGKIAAIAKSRQETGRELEEVKEQLRRSEFARERAESMAKARGAALMKCQEALCDAEEQQVQLSGLLRSALEQLGVGETTGSRTPYTNHSIRSRHSNPSSMRFRYTNITPPSSKPSTYAPSTKETPMTGFTVYSNPVSEEMDRDDFVTPARRGTYYSDEDEQDEQSKTNQSADVARPRVASIGAETAQKLARDVLPHLGSSEIAYLVEYNQNLKEQEQRLQHRVQTANKHAAHTATTANVTKKSKFVVGGEDDGGFLIGTGVEARHPDGIPSVERRRNAAARIVAKLNERLPKELHISSLTGFE